MEKATTFLGFCSKHDNQTFKPIEDEEFSVTAKKCFLIGYRALCHEFYMKKSSNSAAKFQESLVRKHADPILRKLLKRQIEQFNQEVKEGYEIVRKTKEIYDSALTSDEFENFNSVTISFSGKLSIVSTGMVTPDFLIDGKKIQDYSSDDLENLFFGIISNNNRHFFIFHWPKKFELVTKYVTSMLKLKESVLPNFLVQFMFNYIENTYFSEEWWKTLPKKHKDYIGSLAYIPFAYGRSLKFKKINLVDWRDLKIEKNINYA